MQMRCCLWTLIMHHPINVQPPLIVSDQHSNVFPLVWSTRALCFGGPACCGDDGGRRWRLSESVSFTCHQWIISPGRRSVCKLSAREISLLLKIVVPYLKVSSTAKGRNERDRRCQGLLSVCTKRLYVYGCILIFHTSWRSCGIMPRGSSAEINQWHPFIDIYIYICVCVCVCMVM